MPTLYVDIDGTLIDKDDIIRPFVRELFETAQAKGFKIFIWSAGGMDYAQRQARKIFNRLNPKAHVTIVAKDLSMVHISNKTTACIDDMQEVVDSFYKKGLRGFKVPFYESLLFPDDQSLKQVSELL